MTYRLLLLAALCFTAFNANAQGTVSKTFPDTFRIRKFPAAYWYGTEKMRRPKRMESILLAKKDPQIDRAWKTAKTVRGVGSGVMVLGLVLEAVSLGRQLKGEEGNGLLLGGAGLVLGGAIIQMFGNGPTRQAVLRFNDLETGRAGINPEDRPDMTAAGIQRPGISLSGGFNASKIWEIGGSEELRSDEKLWWAKSTPVAIAYALPGRSPVSIELSCLSKGFREKTEMTNTGGTTKIRTDLQLRFLQLAALKKLPLGSRARKLQAHAQGGVFLGYAVSAREKYRSVKKEDDLKRWTRQYTKVAFGDEPGQLNTRRFDAGLLAGAAVSWPLWQGRISLDARGGVGALNLEKTESADPEYRYPSLHTRDLALMVGYSVPVSR